MLVFIFTILVVTTNSKIIQDEKSAFCESLECDDDIEKKVCGFRQEKEGYVLRLFKNECQLMKYGCEAERNFEYGVLNIEYCEKGLSLNNYEYFKEVNGIADKTNDCFDYDCSKTNLGNNVCGIWNNGTGYRIRIFKNNCELLKYNCKRKVQFIVTDYFICNGIVVDGSDTINNVNDDLNKKLDFKVNNRETEIVPKKSNILNNTYDFGVKDQKINDRPIQTDINRRNGEIVDPLLKMKLKNIIIIDTPVFNMKDDIKDSIDNFFATTHVFDLPLKEVDNELNDTRRMQMKTAGPVKVFKPWITIPKNISEDYYHAPTLSSCFHRCPTKCPESYAPVCGRPGIVAREPTLVFKNHCYMDYAQCKMRWENKSPTAISSNYIESSFLFCLGDELNGLYRFLPLIKTLQHMGRLKKKGQFHYKFRNMRFFNNMLRREPKIMG